MRRVGGYNCVMEVPETTRVGIALPMLSPQPELVTLPEEKCVYLPERAARFRAFAASRISPDAYHALMDASFRRSGRMIYQPVCAGCKACVPLRVPVADFRAGKSQRRCVRRNADMRVEVAVPEATEEKFALYTRYRAQWHGSTDASTYESFVSFLYDSPVDTLEFIYRGSGGETLGIGICDISAESLSSVYFYFEPVAAARGLGTFSALYEIEFARQRGIPYWYAGFHVAGCAAMEYKANFRPHELLGDDGVWRAE
jgi:arginine-tRNA-protein transferase